jgi:S1-C subfamily serine protease
MMAVLDDVAGAIQEVARTVGPSVVGVGARWGRGSGVVLAEGKVLTNAHNIRGEEVAVSFPDGRTADGTVAGIDQDADLAVVSVDTGGAPSIGWAEDADVGVGRPVLALANPGGRGLRVTHGFVSGVERSFRGPRGRRIAGSVEHTAPLARGSSGGPIVGPSGGLLGLNTSRAGDGFYLAIPADASLRDRVDGLSRGDSAPAPRLGVAVAPAWMARRMRRAVGLPERDGLLVRGVADDSPAAASGLQQGDLIVEAGGRDVATADDLFEALDQAGPSGSLALTVIRGTEERSVSVALAGRPSRAEEP